MAGAGFFTNPAQSITGDGKGSQKIRNRKKLMKTKIAAKIVVKHRGTKAYISCGEKILWTDHALMARMFETPYHALHFCITQEVANADVVFRSPEGRDTCFLRC